MVDRLAFGFGRKFFLVWEGEVSAHLGEIGPEQENKLEHARCLMICRLLCSAYLAGPILVLGKSFFWKEGEGF